MKTQPLRTPRRVGHTNRQNQSLGVDVLEWYHPIVPVRQRKMRKGGPPALINLPPYLPDPNPTEKLFAKLKALLRKAAKRSVDALWNKIGEFLHTLSSTECANYFASSGYVYTYIRNA